MNDLIVVEKPAEWKRLKALVLDSVSSPITRRVYNMALDEFIDWFGQALVDEVGEGEGRGLRDVDLLAGREHGRELGRMVVERGDRRLDLDAPVGLELLGDARVDVAVGPDHEVEAIDLALGRHAPRAGLLAEGSLRQSGQAETRGCAENAPPAQLPFADQIVAHIVPSLAQ